MLTTAVQKPVPPRPSHANPEIRNDGETVNFAIDQANGHLRTGSDEYQRVPGK